MSKDTEQFEKAMLKLRAEANYDFTKFISLLYTPEELGDIISHGMVGGFHSQTYYWETGIIHDLFEEELWNMAYEYAKDMGLPSVMHLISQSQEEINDLAQLKNWLVWFATETVANRLVEGE